MKKTFVLPQPPAFTPPVFGWNKPWLAPMAGYTDVPFRILCSSFGAAVCETEMISASGLVMENHGTSELLRASSAESTLVAQLFGSNPQHVGKAAQMLRKAGWLYFDFNMGCPAKKVIRQGAGSALLGNLPLALENAKVLIKGVQEIQDNYLAEDMPAQIGFKIRSGYDTGANILPDLALRLEDLGANWLTLHPRYGREGFTGSANWEEIARLAERLAIPLLASGDLINAQAGLMCLKQTGAAGVMYARGALKNPAIFEEHLLQLSDLPEKNFNKHKLGEIIGRHIEAGRQYYDSDRGFKKLRSIMPRYVKHLPGVGDFRQNLAHCHNWDCLLEEINKFLEFSE